MLQWRAKLPNLDVIVCLRPPTFDLRVPTVGKKNIGEDYTQDIIRTLNLSPGKYHSRYVTKIQKTILKRRALIKSSAYKKKTNGYEKVADSLTF